MALVKTQILNWYEMARTIEIYAHNAENSVGNIGQSNGMNTGFQPNRK
jgi:hypothetical protein